MLHHTHRDNRRKHPRFSPRHCTFIAGNRVGKVIDVSRGGMSFYYADRGPWTRDTPRTGSVQSKKNGLLLCDLPLETISDLELPNNFGAGAMAIHRRSIRFGSLTSAQNQQLERFIAMAANN